MKAEEPAAIPYETHPHHSHLATTANRENDGRTVFNKAQLYLLELFSRMESDSELDEVKNLLAKHYANKALDAIDELWEKGTINGDIIQEWKHEHMRTPYIHA